MPSHAHANNGKFTADPKVAERDAKACQMRVDGYSLRMICAELGYSGEAAASKAISRQLRKIVQEPAEELRRMELERLDEAYRIALSVARRRHEAVSAGRLVTKQVPVRDSHGEPVYGPDGNVMTETQPVWDDKPLLEAIDRVVKIQERRARLLGLDAPSKSRVEVITTDQITQAITELEGQIAAREQELQARTGERSVNSSASVS